MGRRRTGRELALQSAYRMDIGALSLERLDEVLDSLPMLDDETPFAPEEAPPQAHRNSPGSDDFTEKDWTASRDFARRLVAGTWDNIGRVDAAIAIAAENWVPERMSAVDRNILRLAAFELLYAAEIPDLSPRATFNEWIEVAKKYSTESSGAFINGILDRIYRERRGSPAPAGRKKTPRGSTR